MYIDDILVLGVSYEDCQAKTRFVVDMLVKLGFIINEKKSNMEPSQTVEYLGFSWDLGQWQVALRPRREVAIREAAAGLRSAGFATCRKVASFLGKALSAMGAVPLARARVRTLQWSFLASCRGEEQYNDIMLITEEASQELEFWERLPAGISSPISLPAAEQTIDTDASDTGVGIYFKGELISEKVPRHFHICSAELFALDRALEVLRRKLQPGTVVWRVDNNAAMQAIRNEGSTHSFELSWLAVRILKKAEEMNIHLAPIRVSSEENILADAASRFKEVPDWSIKDSVVHKIRTRWGHMDVDLMATEESKKAVFFYSWRRCDTNALGLDSLAEDVSWSQWNLPYCFPPFPLVERVLQKAQTQEVAQMVVIVPWWPTKPFFGTLQVLLKLQF